jgi:aspartyl-tRNA(Asn)/glutamyl-tRNA(Gln) amidotransferase subunit A
MQKACLDIMYSEAGAFHRRWMAEHPDRYAPDVLARLQGCLSVSGADYVAALAEQKLLRVEIERAMRGIDALLLPATAAVAPLIAPKVDTAPLVRFTRPFNLTGQPVFSLPAPVSGLPVGIQVVGHVGRDADLAAVALGLEEAWKRVDARVTVS